MSPSKTHAGSLFGCEIQVVLANAASSTDSPRWEILSQSRFLFCFFFLNLESPGEFYSNSGLVVLEVKKTFPRGTESCTKWLSHATSWEPPGLLTAESQEGGRDPSSLQESMHVPHTVPRKPPVTACSLILWKSCPSE